MRNFQNLVIVLTILSFSFISNETNAGILWSKDLVLDSNTNSTPLASCINKDYNGIFIIAKAGAKGTFLNNFGNGVLWEIGLSGEVLRRTLIKDIDGKIVQTNALTIGQGNLMFSDSDGNLLTIGILGEQRKEKSISIVSTSAAEPRIIKSSQLEDIVVNKLIHRPNNIYFLVGGKNNYAAYWRMDNQGKIIKEIIYQHGEHDRFTGSDNIRSCDSNFVTVGLSAKIRGKMNIEGSENFILIYDDNDTLVHKDCFSGGDSISILPKVCSLNDGNIVTVFYKKQDPNSKAGLWARCYTPELNLLWEKELYAIDMSILAFDLISSGSNNFIIALLTSKEGLKIYKFNENGYKIEQAEWDKMFGISGFNTMRLNNRIFIVLEQGSEGNIKELTIKPTIIALD